jgi:biopolymer transport protein TolQ
MNSPQDLSILSLVLNASTLVQAVMVLLLCLSVASWTIIFRKGSTLRSVRRETERFERDFWSGGDLNTLLEAAHKKTIGSPVGGNASVLERIFAAGMQEFLKAKEIDAARRAMKAAYQREMDRLESSLPFLASVGSVSPYIGLFGTVWGIMHAFRGLANVQQATLASVAPGIAEALVATAIGLFAAIPAVIAYNSNSTEIDRLSIHFVTFIEEFTIILQRQASRL